MPGKILLSAESIVNSTTLPCVMALQFRRRRMRRAENEIPIHIRRRHRPIRAAPSQARSPARADHAWARRDAQSS